jgi:hypothetical protein
VEIDYRGSDRLYSCEHHTEWEPLCGACAPCDECEPKEEGS